MKSLLALEGDLEKHRVLGLLTESVPLQEGGSNAIIGEMACPKRLFSVCCQ